MLTKSLISFLAFTLLGLSPVVLTAPVITPSADADDVDSDSATIKGVETSASTSASTSKTKGLFSGLNPKASLANLGSKFNMNGGITADEKKAFKTALIEDDFFYKSKAVKEEDKYSEQHFNEMLAKFQPYLEKICLNAKSLAFSKLIKAHESEFIMHSGRYYLLGEKDANARLKCRRPSIMAAASVLLGALDADGKTLANKDLKNPLMKLLVSNLGSTAAEKEIDKCAELVKKVVPAVPSRHQTETPDMRLYNPLIIAISLSLLGTLTRSGGAISITNHDDKPNSQTPPSSIKPPPRICSAETKSAVSLKPSLSSIESQLANLDQIRRLFDTGFPRLVKDSNETDLTTTKSPAKKYQYTIIPTLSRLPTEIVDVIFELAGLFVNVSHCSPVIQNDNPHYDLSASAGITSFKSNLECRLLSLSIPKLPKGYSFKVRSIDIAVTSHDQAYCDGSEPVNETRHCDGSYTWGELCVSQRQGAVELNTDKISSNSSSLPFDEFSRIIETLYSSSSSADKKDTRRRNPPWAQLSPRLRDISNDPEGKALLENLKSLGIKNSNGEDLYQKRIFTNMRSTSTWQTHIIKYRRSSEKQGKVDYTSSFRVPADVDMIDSAGEDRLPDFSRLTDATVQDVEAVEGGGGRGYKRVRLLSPAGFDEDLGPATNFMDQLNSNDTLHIILRTAFPSWHIYVKQANVTVQLQVYGAKN